MFQDYLRAHFSVFDKSVPVVRVEIWAHYLIFLKSVPVLVDYQWEICAYDFLVSSEELLGL